MLSQTIKNLVETCVMFFASESKRGFEKSFVDTLESLCWNKNGKRAIRFALQNASQTHVRFEFDQITGRSSGLSNAGLTGLRLLRVGERGHQRNHDKTEASCGVVRERMHEETKKKVCSEIQE